MTSSTAEWRRAVRQRTPLALLMIDADHFKVYNDKHGHQAGDRALAEIAAAVVASVRGTIDVAARYGGEEFAVVLPGIVGRGSADSTAEIIRGECRAIAGRIRSH